MPEGPVVHLVDDDDAVRDSLAFLLRSAGYAVRAYGSGQEALDAIADGAAAGCVVTDVRMPGMTGLELLGELRAREQHLPVIVITGHADVPLAVEAMRAGAADFLEKPFDNEALLGAVRRALDTAAPSEDAAQSLVLERIGRLSQRERQVLEGLVEGRLNKTIAFELGISVRTVEVYRAKLMAKMQAETFADLVRMTVQAGGAPKAAG
jgi:two-component system, LuxR family, response regulator FixJ